MTTLVTEYLSNSELGPVVFGMGMTATGALDMVEGNLSSGSVKTLLGMTATNIGTMGHSEPMRDDIIKANIVAGTGTAAVFGITNFCSGLYNRRLKQAGKGLLQAAVGFAGSYLACCVSSRSLALLGQTFSVGCYSACIATSGLRDLARGNFKKGLAKTAFGLSGVAIAGFAAYRELNPSEPKIHPIVDGYSDLDERFCFNPDFEANPHCEEIPFQKDREILIGSTYVPSADPARGEYARLVDSNHAEYARKWNLTHVVGNDPRLLDRTCFAANGTVANGRIVDGELVRCSDYWQKVPEMLRWLKDPNVPMGAERWLIDDDMPITNMAINPYKVFDQLAGGTKPSLILSQDSANWLDNNFPTTSGTGKNDPRFALNGGLWFLRKSEEATRYLEEVWETRNIVHNLYDSKCPTKGLCINQNCLHEQEGAARVLIHQPNWFGRHVLVVPQRDGSSKSRGHLAINTSYRSGCFVKANERGSVPFGYLGDPEETFWRPGDFMGQPNGVPTKGVELPPPPHRQFCWHLRDNLSLPERPIRKDRIQRMIDLTYSVKGCVAACIRKIFEIKTNREFSYG